MHPLEASMIKYAQTPVPPPPPPPVPSSPLEIAVPAGAVGGIFAATRGLPRTLYAGALVGGSAYYAYLQMMKTAPRLLYKLLQLDLESAPGRSEMERLALALTYAHGVKELENLQKDLLAGYIVKLKEQEEKMKKRKEKGKEGKEENVTDKI